MMTRDVAEYLNCHYITVNPSGTAISRRFAWVVVSFTDAEAPTSRSGSRSGKPAGSVVTSLTGARATSANRGPKAIGKKHKTFGGPTVGAAAGATPVFGVCKRAFNFPKDQIYFSHFSHDLRGRLKTS
jgi:hypothetical protein